MSQTHITGLLKDSGGTVFGGTLKVTLDAPLLEGEALLTTKSKTFTIPNTGVIDLHLEESETSQITYYFELKDANGDDVIPPFHAIVPNLEEVLFFELYPVSALTDLLPAGLRRLAQIIATNETYAAALQSFRPEGEYDPDIFYGKGSLVTFGGGSYLYVAEILTKGKTPTLHNGNVPGNEIYWQTIAVQGDTGGLAPENDTFDRTLWTGNYLAPTKNSLAEVIVDRNAPAGTAAWNKTDVTDFSGLELLTLTDLIAHFAKKTDAVLTGDPQAPNKGVGDSTSSIATCKHVKDSIDAVTEYVNNRLRVYAFNNSSELIATSGQFLTITGWVSESIDLGSDFNPTTGQWVCPASGFYRIWGYFSVQRNGASYTASSPVSNKSFYKVNTSTNILLAPINTASLLDFTSINGIAPIAQGDVCELRLFATFTGGPPTVPANSARLSIEWVSP